MTEQEKGGSVSSGLLQEMDCGQGIGENMSCLKIYQDNYTDATIVSNRFIDEYMAEANDAQLKIYLYLLRMMHSGRSVGISEIADAFNHTEKDVMRALKYWEKRDVLLLEYNADRNLSGIRLLDLAGRESAQPSISQASLRPASMQESDTARTVQTASASMVQQPQEQDFQAVSAPAQPSKAAPSSAFSKPSYTLDELKAFQENESTAQLLFIAEQYLGRTLSPSDMKSILFFSDKLHFSFDLIDYLLQYCIERGKKDLRYMEKVAISWAEAHVTTPAEAESHSSKYDRTVYTIMNALGKSSSPTRREAEYIRRWREEYGFEPSIIIEACERTVLATDKHRFEYADKILSSWKEAGVHHAADIARLDASFQKERPARQAPARSAEKYNRFMHNSYDYDALEKELLHN